MYKLLARRYVLHFCSLIYKPTLNVSASNISIRVGYRSTQIPTQCLKGAIDTRKWKLSSTCMAVTSRFFTSVYLSTNLRDRKRYKIKYIATTFHYTTLYFQTTKKFFLSEANIIKRTFLHLIYVLSISLTLRWLMSYIYGAPILDVSRSHTTTQHSR